MQTNEDASPSYSLTRDLEGKPHVSLALWYEFLLNYFTEADKNIVICGPSGCGKTCLFYQLINKKFIHTIPTDNYSFLFLGESDETTIIEETSKVCEDELYDNITVGTADLLILVLDYTCQNLETVLMKYLECFTRHMSSTCRIMVLLNKRDLLCIAVSSDKIRGIIEDKIKDREWLLYEASAKTGESNLIAWSGDGHAPAAPTAQG